MKTWGDCHILVVIQVFSAGLENKALCGSALGFVGPPTDFKIIISLADKGSSAHAPFFFLAGLNRFKQKE